ncbi:iron chelate uptake ABC transporter family permease subunit [Virgibacillus halodenitrificans]|jgi:iron complex transport system permease protein|uniref:Iron ABC transporter permease n=1 Tax=Virgibacillus halodenitrificans TaxID=1482 RepID=A0AAC9IWH4_VIRHA|nr:iron chelate uptake ABC transporter family permease subunit [Virgibacillus halodenitrificans]APC47023.1 iron ABC transporter permease [Virgibacillus halodenitrificans]MBD1223069.1 iron chelate uptake ABC transporter family permease subunit [Virgibacillus halodenitrificans]MCG1027377.1 iron chelate uptake ABC transporter family permease subunit [Virgibacillus halodenitrificans]MCJ0930327.1 iron chelate uptake ABC transporter family permease subunit [Virgibacillus halodenitrificans]MEC2159121
MDYKKKTIILAIVAALLACLYIFYNLTGNIDYILPRRIIKVVAIILTGGAIAFATTIFMTITNNRILTPSVMGLDSLYLLIQTMIVFVFGSQSLVMMNSKVNYLVSIGCMVVFSLILYRILFKGEKNNIYFLLLIGMILGTFFGSLTSFMQVLIDPNEFMIAQDKMFASINNVNTDLVYLSVGLIVLVALYFMRYFKYLDVLALGKDEAINLGVPYDHVVKRLLIIVAVLIAISTALVGPITFLGLLVVNVAYEFLKTFRHSYLLTGSMLISIIALLGGQFIVEKIFTFQTTISVIINFVGGVYFIYLLLKENKSW